MIDPTAKSANNKAVTVACKRRTRSLHKEVVLVTGVVVIVITIIFADSFIWVSSSLMHLIEVIVMLPFSASKSKSGVLQLS